MRDSHWRTGQPALLFERLEDRTPDQHHEFRPQRVLDRAAVEESVQRELSRLLNTRCPLAADAFMANANLTVLNYGVPDFVHRYAKNPQDRLRLSRLIEHAVRAFEPRLQSPRAMVEPVVDQPRRLAVRLEGAIRVGLHLEQVSFLLALGENDLPRIL